ncbi:MAG: rhomboid family intramembrane serine protease [Geobacteraceae bacterium]|nr:rhomboid family intramembrane serine protease [Geobacteraceae bacterium]
MSISDYFEQHEEQAFVAKALATAVAIILVKNYLAGLISFLIIIFPVVFLIIIRMHAAASGVSATDLLKEHITFFPVMRSEDERRKEIKPWVTYGIILVNVLIFYGFEMSIEPELISNNLVFLPRDPNLFNVPLSAFTSIFLHASGGHLWGNMMFLWVVGSAVERRVGWKTFSWIYMVTGLIGGCVYLLIEFLFHGEAGHILGASGAIAGIMGIFAVRCYFKSMIFPVPILGIFSLILPISLKVRLNSLVIMALFFLSDLSGGISQITGENASMIGHWAHLGGMISGMLLAGRLKLAAEAMEERHLDIGLKASEATIGFEGGKRSMQIVLDRSPDNIDAILGMARLETKFHATPEGKELYEKTLNLMSRSRQAEVAAVLREYYKKYLDLPTEPLLISRLAEIVRRAGENELCILCLERLVELKDVASELREKSLFQLASLLEYTSQFDAARLYFARFVAEYPESIMVEKARMKAGDEVYTPALKKVVQEKITAPTQICPACGAGMTSRPAAAGANKGKHFWVCSRYPECSSYLPMDEPVMAAEPMPAPLQQLPKSYRLVFDGTISLSADPNQAKENLAKLMRCGEEQIDRLFSNRQTVLKKNLEHGAALKMKDAFDRTGAICALEAE